MSKTAYTELALKDRFKKDGIKRPHNLAMSAIQQPKLHRFSLEQYYELGELGLLDQRTELLEGIITDMEPIGPYHANVGDHLSQIFQQQAGDRYRVPARMRVFTGPTSRIYSPRQVFSTRSTWAA